MKKIILALIAACLVLSLAGCSKSSDRIVIYTSSEEKSIAIMEDMLSSKFPQVDIAIEYIPTGNHAARLKAEGLNTECDITYDLEYGYLEMLNAENILEDLSDFDMTKYVPDLLVSEQYLPCLRYSGSIVVNSELLAEKNLPVPESYEDLLRPEYKGLISMPNPSTSGTGYMFLKSLVNAWGEDRTYDYFDRLSENILQFTASGTGPINALEKKEVAIGLTMTSHAAIKKTEGVPLEILFFEEGSPYTACGTSIIKGKMDKPMVKEVFTYFYTDITAKLCEEVYPESIYNDITFQMENYPENIPYANMTNDNAAEKERLLSKWKH